MKKMSLAAAAVAGLVTALPAAAQFQKPGDAIEYRQSAFTLIASHFGRVAAMAQGKAPFDAKVAAENIAIVSTLAKLPLTAFGPGTDKGHGTEAKAAVWSDAAGFKAAADKYVAAIDKLDAAGKTGDFAQIKAAVGETGGSCKGCHDKFKEK
ncbi:cytochrome c [Rubrivivax sp. JA1024]|uniref:c-type cytochrome n=1 Tax=Rubrivivax sp. JA1026 TaxID=2710888 RepID=UPI0013E9284B|nr:cytochrome c [Rubrivivax sp. JA1026]MCD0422835.1 cytochrome c [Rubrivivax sp. JA1024]